MKNKSPISFDNKKEVMKYIHEKPRLFEFYNELPTLAKKAFGKHTIIHLSRPEEGRNQWLKIKIKAHPEIEESSYTVNKGSTATHKFFRLIEEHQPPFKIHQYVIFYLWSRRKKNE